MQTIILQRVLLPADKEIADAFTRASCEAMSAFGNGAMFIEKYVEVCARFYASCVQAGVLACEKSAIGSIGNQSTSFLADGSLCLLK